MGQELHRGNLMGPSHSVIVTMPIHFRTVLFSARDPPLFPGPSPCPKQLDLCTAATPPHPAGQGCWRALGVLILVPRGYKILAY